MESFWETTNPLTAGVGAFAVVIGEHATSKRDAAKTVFSSPASHDAAER